LQKLLAWGRRILQDMTMLFVPLLALELKLEFWQIGVLIALLYVPVIFSFIFSIIADKVDRLNIVIFGLILSLFPLIFLSFTEVPLYVGILSSLISFSVSMIRPAGMGIVASLAKNKDMAQIAGLEVFFGQVGVVFSSIILGIIAQYFGIKIVFSGGSSSVFKKAF
jgi:predicted MFS family arabinose efflux permease